MNASRSRVATFTASNTLSLSQNPIESRVHAFTRAGAARKGARIEYAGHGTFERGIKPGREEREVFQPKGEHL